MQQTFKFEKERELGDVITDTFVFIREQFKSLAQIFAKIILPFLVVNLAISLYYQYAALHVSNDILSQNSAFDIFNNISQLILPLILTIISAVLFYTVSYLAILCSIKSYVLKGEIEIEYVQSEVKQKFWSMLGLLIVSFIIIFVSALLCVLPVFYFMVPVSIMYSIMVFEDRSVGDTISHAFELIKENFWMTLLTIIVVFLIIGFASGIFQVPLIIYSLFNQISALEARTVDYNAAVETDWVFLILNTLGTLGSSVLSLVSLISFSLVYYNLNEKHNLTGTAQEIDSIGNN
ncbi:hypothetical protein [Psychroflexus salis]|uniref:Glycerophosphoryl diester phosphodiesterase membrane domain-containing protein n=1 Tax=Psychroflexus salis TaxID=1526574 RepID=A0A917A143_9FLAO|nr:hypothetical protein [Psychroflexus salis]GGE19751.1 hypothetical protein GCM10010831_21100 [Psychroflexus salis]